MLIIDPESGHILDVNQKACTFYGYRRDQILHMRITDINTLSPEAVFEEMERAKNEKRRYFNFRHRLKGGEIRDITARKQSEHKLKAERDKLKKALDQIQVLRGMLPICAACKKIRDDKGYWNQIESYIRAHSEAEFSHSICPECSRSLYPDIALR